MPGRNVNVEEAVRRALGRIDDFISGSTVGLPSPPHRRACEELLDGQAASVRTAALFLAFYWLTDPSWDCETVPVGVRGERGDKLLCEELTNRNITLHGSITAYGENLGWKGNVRNVRLSNDPRFQDFFAKVRDARGSRPRSPESPITSPSGSPSPSGSQPRCHQSARTC